jgi:uncharacterized Zn finger protein
MRRKRRRTYHYYSDFEPTRPIETEHGIQARSQRGQFAKNWWAMRWIGAMERLVDPGRLTRGRSYARKGQVLSIEEKGKGIEAWVQGSRPKPYKVTIRTEHLDERVWENLIDTLAGQALYAAQLLAGEMPADIEQAFEQAGASLFPARPGDLTTHCSCPDYANPCKHVAATHYILGERFDEDPFLLFRMRAAARSRSWQVCASDVQVERVKTGPTRSRIRNPSFRWRRSLPERMAQPISGVQTIPWKGSR